MLTKSLFLKYLASSVLSVCTSVMQINTDVKTAAALLDQFYEKRRLLVVSTPNVANPYYKFQNVILQVSHWVLFLFLQHMTSRNVPSMYSHLISYYLEFATSTDHLKESLANLYNLYLRSNVFIGVLLMVSTISPCCDLYKHKCIECIEYSWIFLCDTSRRRTVAWICGA